MFGDRDTIQFEELLNFGKAQPSPGPANEHSDLEAEPIASNDKDDGKSSGAQDLPPNSPAAKLEQYQVMNVLGMGSFNSHVRVLNQSGEFLTMKRQRNDRPNRRPHGPDELLAMSSPFLLRICDVITTDATYVFYEWADGPDLSRLLHQVLLADPRPARSHPPPLETTLPKCFKEWPTCIAAGSKDLRSSSHFTTDEPR